jgi:uncharacterized membrane protein
VNLQTPQLGSPQSLPQPLRVESRWPAALAAVAMFLVLTVSSSRTRVLPLWATSLALVALLVPMAMDWLSGGHPRWQRLEHGATLIFAVCAETAVLMSLCEDISEMLHGPAVSGQQLLTSSVAAWVTNVVAFSLLYWRIDRGGPDGRALDETGTKHDWQFPQTQAADEVPGKWRPTYPDYLFLSFCTATAFSPTDALPLTTRAKMLMMVESTVSLTTLVIVASRAINILGGQSGA